MSRAELEELIEALIPIEDLQGGERDKNFTFI
jgi:hypothetical protein